jgi:hypothetical protein
MSSRTVCDNAAVRKRSTLPKRAPNLTFSALVPSVASLGRVNAALVNCDAR